MFTIIAPLNIGMLLRQRKDAKSKNKPAKDTLRWSVCMITLLHEIQKKRKTPQETCHIDKALLKSQAGIQVDWQQEEINQYLRLWDWQISYQGYSIFICGYLANRKINKIPQKVLNWCVFKCFSTFRSSTLTTKMQYIFDIVNIHTRKVYTLPFFLV